MTNSAQENYLCCRSVRGTKIKFLLAMRYGCVKMQKENSVAKRVSDMLTQ